MEINIAILFILSAAFPQYAELSSPSTSYNESSSRMSVQFPYSLNSIPGLQIPRGLEIKYRQDIIAVNQNGLILPCMQNGEYTILKSKQKRQRNSEATEFEAKHITDVQWLIVIGEWANEMKIGSWAIDSAVRTVQRIHLAQIADKQYSHNNIQQRAMVNHPGIPVEQQNQHNYQPARLAFSTDSQKLSTIFDLPEESDDIEAHESDANPCSTSNELIDTPRVKGGCLHALKALSKSSQNLTKPKK